MSGTASEVSDIGSNASKITEKLDNLADDVPTGALPGSNGPTIPPSLTESKAPVAPHIPDTPAPHVPDSTPVDRSPTAPHSSTPTSTPTHAPAAPGETPHTGTPPIGGTPESRVSTAVEAPSAPHQTASTLPNSTMPTNATPPAAAPHSPAAEAPSPTHSGSSGFGDEGGRPGGNPTHEADRSAEHDGDSSHPDGSHHDASERSDEHSETHEHVDADSAHNGRSIDDGLTDERRDEILAMERGTRPDPSEYLSPEYIERHLEKFDDGASRFMPQENFDKYGIAQRDGTSFVMPTREINDLMEATKGDPRAMEQALGWPEGYLDKHKVLRIDIPDPQTYNLRIPSGNEAGANELWVPGGMLPGDFSEGVIDGREIPLDGYTISDLSK